MTELLVIVISGLFAYAVGNYRGYAQGYKEAQHEKGRR